MSFNWNFFLYLFVAVVMTMDTTTAEVMETSEVVMMVVMAAQEDMVTEAAMEVQWDMEVADMATVDTVEDIRYLSFISHFL